ncbi:Rpn family recombination-promoting nuclease/putative transposase [Bordetella genomosp. 13]|uniref:Uncharacterized protein n=1 Tax=Bordetella genomosp. 13 TaxID=463040 RepID=A0A1W6Z9K9_9BORD|nr:Rpn family recombination-promoting nuclease/putative transposase [Bordetella genomosp. 13]ARP94088.1 hypothetical protein CAL15_06645 [Bordetella genomosp. 13]
MPRHDALYKRLFSHAPMMRALLQGFTPEGLAGQVDLLSLEKVSGSFVARDRRAGHSDLVWRARAGAGKGTVYLLLEFQSRVDAHMALRMMTYLGLLYEDLLLQGIGGARQPLPAVLPMVLYSGAQRWHAPRELGESVAPFPEGLKPFQPRLQYLLVDQVRLAQSGALPSHNLAAVFFQIQAWGSSESLTQAVRTLYEGTSTSDVAELRRDLVRWLREQRLFHEQADMLLEPDDAREIRTMLGKMIEEILNESANDARAAGWAQGLEQGREQGIEQGLEQGRHALLEQLLAHRFGPLPPSLRMRLDAASPEQLGHWAIAMLDAPSLDAVFAQPAH